MQPPRPNSYCGQCGYPLISDVDTTCPECGSNSRKVAGVASPRLCKERRSRRRAYIAICCAGILLASLTGAFLKYGGTLKIRERCRNCGALSVRDSISLFGISLIPRERQVTRGDLCEFLCAHGVVCSDHEWTPRLVREFDQNGAFVADHASKTLGMLGIWEDCISRKHLEQVRAHWPDMLQAVVTDVLQGRFENVALVRAIQLELAPGWMPFSSMRERIDDLKKGWEWSRSLEVKLQQERTEQPTPDDVRTGWFDAIRGNHGDFREAPPPPGR